MTKLTLIETKPSVLGSQQDIENYRDEEGNIWTGINGGTPVMTFTAESLAHLKERGAAAREAGRKARGQ